MRARPSRRRVARDGRDAGEDARPKALTTYLVTATRGERGRFGDGTEPPDPDIVGRTREAELRAAAKELGVREVGVARLSGRRARQRRSGGSDASRSPGICAASGRTSSITFGAGRRLRSSRSHRDQPADDGGDRVRRRSVVSRRAAIGEPHRVVEAVLHRVEREEVGRVSGGAEEAGDHGGRRRAPGGAVARLGDHHASSTPARSGRRCGAPCRATRRR